MAWPPPPPPGRARGGAAAGGAGPSGGGSGESADMPRWPVICAAPSPTGSGGGRPRQQGWFIQFNISRVNDFNQIQYELCVPRFYSCSVCLFPDVNIKMSERWPLGIPRCSPLCNTSTVGSLALPLPLLNIHLLNGVTVLSIVMHCRETMPG